MIKDAEYSFPLSVAVAKDVLSMYRELETLRAENESLLKYKDLYLSLLNASAKNTHILAGGGRL
jgi:hypothetical protein